MDRSQLVYLAFAVLALLVGALGTRWLGRARNRGRARRRAARAQQGERDAEALLQRAGYAFAGLHVPATWTIYVDDQARDVDVRADLIVTRGRERYVAEVKTGDLAPRLTTAATRRQLLEYRLAYQVDGVLLVDVESDRVVAVEFPLPQASASNLTWVGALLAGVALGLLAGLWLPLS